MYNFHYLIHSYIFFEIIQGEITERFETTLEKYGLKTFE